MNEVGCTNLRNEIETLAEVQTSGMTGFQEKFKVHKLVIHCNTFLNRLTSITKSTTNKASIDKVQKKALEIIKLHNFRCWVMFHRNLRQKDTPQPYWKGITTKIAVRMSIQVSYMPKIAKELTYRII